MRLTNRYGKRNGTRIHKHDANSQRKEFSELDFKTSGGLQLVGLRVKAYKLVVCNLRREKYDWKKPNWPLLVQTGESVEEAKVFEAQQQDGDDLLQNIVTNLGKESRKGLTNGLREFIEVDNEHALDSGALRRSTGTFKYGSRKCQKDAHKLLSGKIRMS